MVKIAFSSDNHFDVNRIDVNQIVMQQAQFLMKQKIDYYVDTGDTFNDFQQTLHYFETLQQLVKSQTKVYFVAGNHDMRRGVTYAELNQDLSPLYLNHKMIKLTGTNNVLIGNNGWYDYSFADQFLLKKQVSFRRWKDALWFDGMIAQPLSDPARMQNELVILRRQFQQIRQQHQQAILATHFVPHQNYMIYSYDKPQWDMINAYLGSRHLEELLNEYRDVVKIVAFGHLHLRDPLQVIDNITYVHRPVGYHRGRRLNEWQSNDFMTEWRHTLTVITL